MWDVCGECGTVAKIKVSFTSQQTSHQIKWDAPSVGLRHDSLRPQGGMDRRDKKQTIPLFGPHCISDLTVHNVPCQTPYSGTLKNWVIITIEKKESNICSTWVKSCSRYQAFGEPANSQKQFFWEIILAFVTLEIWLALDSIRGFLCTASSPIFLSGAELNFPRKFWTLEMLAHATGPPPSCRAVSLQGRGMTKLRMLDIFKVWKCDHPNVSWQMEKCILQGGTLESMDPKSKLSRKVADWWNDFHTRLDFLIQKFKLVKKWMNMSRILTWKT